MYIKCYATAADALFCPLLVAKVCVYDCINSCVYVCTYVCTH